MDSKEVRRWLEKADYDLKTAKAMHAAGRYLYVLFCCQQALEKLIKAIIIEKTDELPPRIHNLVRLNHVAGIELSDSDTEFMDRLTDFYIKTRYPETLAKLQVIANRTTADKSLKETKRLYKWLISLMK